MAGSFIFPVICAMIVATTLAQRPQHFLFGPPRPSQRSSWGSPSNEIFGITEGPSPFRPPPGVLVAGHGPPVSRLFGPVRHGGGRPPFQMITSTPIPTATLFASPSAFPTHGPPSIQRAKESSHFEYEVMPRLQKPPTILRAGPPRFPPRPIPTQMPTPPDMIRVLPTDAVITTSSMRPPLRRRTDRPPPPFAMASHPSPFGVTGPPPPFAVTGHGPVGPPTYATPSDADFQEGFRILNDLFREETGGDIRSNLVGGSDVHFSGGYFPSMEGANKSNSAPSPKPPAPTPAIQITPAKEQGILIAGTPPKNEEESSEEQNKAPAPSEEQIKQESHYGPAHYLGAPESHTSFLFSDPNEDSGPYNLYSSGYEPGPPPPFHTIGNSIIPPPLPPSRQPKPPQEGRQAAPPQNRPKSPQNNYGPPPPPGTGLRSGPPGPTNAPIPMPMMMMPLEQTGNEPPPSSEEVQRALGILARYASKQAQSMGMSATPQMMLQMMQQGGPKNAQGPPQKPEKSSTPSSTYGPPPPKSSPPNNGYSAPQASPPSNSYGPPEPQQASTPSNSYGPPPLDQQQSTPTPDFLNVQVTAPPVPSGYNNPVDQSIYSYNTEPAEAVTISAPQESSPFPAYGPPQSPPQGSSGGYEIISGGYSHSHSSGGGGGWSSSGSSGGGWGSSGGGAGAAEILGSLRTIGSAVTGGIQQVGALKAGILNAGLNVLGGLGHAKGDIANSLKIPIMSKQPKPVYGPPTSSSAPPPQYGPPQGGNGWGSNDDDGPGPIGALVNVARGVVGGIAGTVAATGKAAVGIGVSKNEFVKNHFVIKGQAFTDTVSKKIQNKNEYFQNVLKHVTSIFEAAKKKPAGGWGRR